MLEKLALKAPTGIERIVSENKDIKATTIKTGIIPVDLFSFFKDFFLFIFFSPFCTSRGIKHVLKKNGTIYKFENASFY